MRYRLHSLLLFSGLAMLVFGGCKKEKLELPTENVPVFKATGTVDGSAFSLVAGDNGAYMHTMTGSGNGVNIYSGNLTDGSLSIELGIYDGLLDIPNHEMVQQLPNNIIFSQAASNPIVTLDKSIFSNSVNIQSVEWFANNVPIGINTASIIQPGLYEVRANITYQDLTTASLTNSMIVGYAINANSNLEETVNGSMLTAEIIDNSVPISKVLWFLDDTFIGEVAPLELQLSPALHTLRAEIHYSNQVVQTKSMLIDAVNNSKTMEDFSIFENGTSSFVARDFNIRLKVKHNGSHYSSELAENSSSTIELTSVELYGQNSNGKDVYKVSALIEAMVGSETSSDIIPVHIDAVFGIEAP